jgi:3'(2'), 5'-bisphosphate nucleotidase
VSIELTQEILHTLRCIAEAAGQATLQHYHAPHTEEKGDGSPLTRADLAADKVIEEGLAAAFPQVLRVSEEGSNKLDPADLQQADFFLIDPLDGTKEFIKKNGEFTVNIALVRRRVAIAGVVHTPATGESWMGAVGLGAWKTHAGHQTRLSAQGVGEQTGWVVMGSRSHADDAAMESFLKGKPVARFVPAGSSLKFCKVAQGDADVYPRLGPTMEWDTAAAHAVLAAAGGWVTQLDGSPLLYAKPDFRNPFFMAGACALSVADVRPLAG